MNALSRRINVRNLQIPRHHEWFFSRVCGGNPLTYLANRHLLETTLFSIRATSAPALSKEPDTNAPFDQLPWPGAEPCGDFVLNGVHSLTDKPTGRTTFRVAQYGKALYVAVRCEDPDGIRKMPSPRGPLFNGKNLHMLRYMSDYVLVMIAPKNDHLSYWQFAATPSGGKLTATVEYDRRLYYPVYPLSRNTKTEEKAPRVTAKWDLRVIADKDRRGWTAFFRVPLSLVGAAGASVAGFNVCRVKQSMPPEQSAWSDLRWFGENFHAPLRLGDLYLRPSPIAVRNLWLGEGLLGREQAVLEVMNRGPKPLRTRWRVSYSEKGKAGRKVFRSAAMLSAGSNLVKLPYVSTACWPSRPLKIEALPAGKAVPLFETEYLVTAFPHLEEQNVPRPSPSDKNYTAAKGRWIASRLPRMMRVNTADGAPSDFCLADRRGKVMFDLMKPGAIRRIAQFIETRFADPEDCLAAADVILRQPDLFVWEPVECFGDSQSTGLSVLRLGTGICGARATIMKDIVEALHPAGGGRYRAYRYGIIQWHLQKGVIKTGGHCQLLVVFPDGHEIMLNTFVYRTKDRRLGGPADSKLFAQTQGWKDFDPEQTLIIDSGSRPWPTGAPGA